MAFREKQLMMGFKRFGAAVLLALVAVVSAQAGDANVGRASGVKVLLVGDTKPFPGGDVDSDLNTLEARFKGLPGFDPERDLRVLKGDDVTAKNILGAVDDLAVRYTDALFCYYGGHGAYDLLGGHYLQIPSSGDLRRAELMRHLKAKGARLTVLITDICNVYEPFHPNGFPTKPPDKVEDLSVKNVPTVTSATLETLLFDFTGVVDVNAADRGQSSWSSHHGCYFTQSLLETLKVEDESRDPIADLRRLFGDNPKTEELPETWGLFLDRAAVKANTAYQQQRKKEMDAKVAIQEEIDQEEQRPQVFQLDVRRAEKATEKVDDYLPPSPFGPDGRLKSPWDELQPQGK
jgi:hypothetical protein